MLTRRRRRLSALTLTERAVAALLHPKTGLVSPSPQRDPGEVQRAAAPHITHDRPGGLRHP